MAFARAAFRARFCISIPPGGIFPGGIFLPRAYGNAPEKRKMDAPFIAAVRLVTQLGRAILGRRSAPVSAERFQGETAVCAFYAAASIWWLLRRLYAWKREEYFCAFFLWGLAAFFPTPLPGGQDLPPVARERFWVSFRLGHSKRKGKREVLHIHLLTYSTSP